VAVSHHPFLVDPTTGEVRLLPFESTENFRDLGGYASALGGTVRWRTVFRSDGLQSLTDADLALFESLGIRAVYDLRRDSERESRPNRVPSDAHCLMTSVDQAGALSEVRPTLTGQRGGEELLRSMYAQMVEHSAVAIAGVFAELADAGRLPALFHCHAGKDRTGLVAALLLDLLGVDRERVLDDYEVSSVLHRDNPHSYQMLIESGLEPAAAAGALGAPRWAMEATLAEIDEGFGGAVGYLVDEGGLERRAVDRLRDLLLDT
jgi:protein-tyrosine phosphatase